MFKSEPAPFCAGAKGLKLLRVSRKKIKKLNTIDFTGPGGLSLDL